MTIESILVTQQNNTMALAIISSIATAGALTPIAIMTLIPLIAIGMNYYRYQAYDPESKIIDVPYVST